MKPALEYAEAGNRQRPENSSIYQALSEEAPKAFFSAAKYRSHPREPPLHPPNMVDTPRTVRLPPGPQYLLVSMK
jgi:hypothetical protein